MKQTSERLGVKIVGGLKEVKTTLGRIILTNRLITQIRDGHDSQ
jgi:hypothetical protein